MKRMSSTFFVALLALTFAIPAVVSAGTTAEARRYERLMAKSQSLRQDAEHARQDGKRAAAKKLDRRADGIEKQAQSAEASDWPPTN